MSSSDYHPSSYSSLEQRRDRALRNRPDPYEKTTGRQSPAIVSPRDDHSTVTSSLRFEPTYLTSAVTKDDDSDGGGNSRSSSWEEAEAEWACSVSSGTPKAVNHSKKQSNTRRLDPYVESIRESVDDFQSTDGEDSLLQSEDDDSAINQRLMKNKFNKHPKFRVANFRKPATAHKGMHAFQQPSIINSTQSRQKVVNNTVPAHGADDEYSSNSNSVESFPTQAPPPILRKSESYISNQSNDTTLSDAESDADEDEEMNRNRRKVKFQETSRGVLQNTIHEYEDESITDTGTVLTDKSEQDDSVSTPNRAPPFPTIINENVEDALLDFFFLGKSAHPRPKKNKKSSRKKTSKESKKSSSSSRKNRNQEDFEKPSRKTREDDDFVPMSRTTRNQEDFAPSYRKEDFVPSSRKTRDQDEYSADDDYTAGSQTTLDTNTVGSEGDDTTINSSVAYEACKKRQIAEETAKKQADEKDMDPFEMVGNFCHIVGNVCGLSQGKPPKFVDVKNRKNGEIDDGTLDSSALNCDDTSQNASKKTWGAFDFSSMDKAIDPQVFADAQSNLIVMAYKCQNWVEQTTGFKVAENTSCTTADDSNTEAPPAVVEKEQLEQPKEDHDETEVADENDEKELENGLLELVKCAARSKHLQNGSVYDETYDIDVTTEVKFLIVYASLPLGVIFKENSGGCFVSRIFKSKGDSGVSQMQLSVEVGDQLTAINGKSAMKKTVTQVCSAINSSPDPEKISLTFLRYTGAIHSTTPRLNDETDVVAPIERYSPSPQKIDTSSVEAAASEITFIQPDIKTTDPNRNLPQANNVNYHRKNEAKIISAASRQPLKALNMNVAKNKAAAKSASQSLPPNKTSATSDRGKKKGILGFFKRKKK